MADKRGTDASTLARTLIERSRAEGRHVGFFLFEQSARTARGELYVAARLSLAAALTLLAGCRWGVWAAVLLFFPISEATASLTDFILSRFVRPRRLPRIPSCPAAT